MSWINKNFFDPGFAIAAAMLSLGLFPFWLLLSTDSPIRAVWLTGIFSTLFLILMLWNSYVIARGK